MIKCEYNYRYMDFRDIDSFYQADQDWKNARRKVLYQHVVCAISQCSVDLLSFEEVRKRLHLSQRIDRGLQEIPLERVRGSVGRYNDFTSAFLPRGVHLQERWKRVDKASRAGKTPPIEVYQVGQGYFVLDGNHRVSVARQRGLKTIEAYVIEYPTSLGEPTAEQVDAHLLQIERAAFQEGMGSVGGEAVEQFKFTCPGCYRLLLGQIENYREAFEAKQGAPVSMEEAYTAWHAEVYTPAVQAMREYDLLSLFPDRSEADLFIWAWENSRELEELVSE